MGRSYLTVRALVVTVTCLVCLEYFSLLQVLVHVASSKIIGTVIRCCQITYQNNIIMSCLSKQVRIFLLQVCRASGSKTAETCLPCGGRERGGRQMEVNIRTLDSGHWTLDMETNKCRGRSCMNHFVCLGIGGTFCKPLIWKSC